MTKDLYHNCRWCRHGRDGKCYELKEHFNIPTTDDLHEEMLRSIGDGNLNEAITEVLNSHFSTLQAAKSDKDMDEIIAEIAEDIERCVSNLPYDNDLDQDGIETASYTDFYCCKFE